MKLITVLVPKLYLDAMDELVRIGMYQSRSAVMRIAVRDLIKNEMFDFMMKSLIADQERMESLKRRWREHDK